MLGERIRKVIKDAGIKQIDVCRAIGISPSRFSNYLSDSREPNFETLCKICDCLNINLDDLRSVQKNPLYEALDILSATSEEPVLIVKGIRIEIPIPVAYRVVKDRINTLENTLIPMAANNG